jgi:hypothetical protein
LQQRWTKGWKQTAVAGSRSLLIADDCFICYNVGLNVEMTELEHGSSLGAQLLGREVSLRPDIRAAQRFDCLVYIIIASEK